MIYLQIKKVNVHEDIFVKNREKVIKDNRKNIQKQKEEKIIIDL